MNEIYKEQYRPQYHFSPAAGWMNDPNGMLYLDGEYHLFYQHIPGAAEQDGGRIHWGHAVSPDMVHWQHLPPALAPDELGAIWSGSAVVDTHNTGGWQTGPGSDNKTMVAIFTHQKEGLQQQSIAYSRDRGRTWTKYEGNPVIPNPGLPDFRDPNVIWHQPTGQWVMVLSGGDRAIFYTSPDLKRWTPAGQFGPDQGARGAVWECPALFALPVDGDPQRRKWVLLVSLSAGAPNGGPGTEYFIGDFDGHTFHNDFSPRTVHWLDYGRDNYAAISFGQTADDRRILMGWLSNWYYARQTPTHPWRGAMTIPREIELQTGPGGRLRLIGRPIPELQALRQTPIRLNDIELTGLHAFAEIDRQLSGAFEIEIEIDSAAAAEWGLILGNDRQEETIIGYDVEGRRLFTNRQYSGAIRFNSDFAGYLHPARLLPDNGRIRLHIFVDWSSIEIIAAAGRLWHTNLIFPTTPLNRLQLYTHGGQAHLHSLTIWPLKSAWP